MSKKDVIFAKLKEIVRANSQFAVDSAMPPKEDDETVLVAVYFEKPTVSLTWGELRQLVNILAGVSDEPPAQLPLIEQA